MDESNTRVWDQPHLRSLLRTGWRRRHRASTISIVLDLKTVRRIYFVGIGGYGMSAAAGIARQFGYEVTGSDERFLYEPVKELLDYHQIAYTAGYDRATIERAAADLHIVSSSEDADNPELAYLRESGVPYYSFSWLLRSLSQDKTRVVVAGTHGKSTTAGMLGLALQRVDDSSFMIGAVLRDSSTNFHVGRGRYFVFEGDEYRALNDDPTPKLYEYSPEILLLTNLEFDHPDLYKSFGELKSVFATLVESIPSEGLIAFNADSHGVGDLVHRAVAKSVSFGLRTDATFRAVNVRSGQDGTVFDVVSRSKDQARSAERYEIGLFGQMNVYNSLGVVAVLRSLGVTWQECAESLRLFPGMRRRFELVDNVNGVHVYDDYAHHPTAIRETLRAARTKYAERRIWAVFEPHTFSRTRALLRDLGRAFSSADEVLVAEVYAAREEGPETAITGARVQAEVRKHHSRVRLVTHRHEARRVLRKEVRPGDVVVLMAVGSFSDLAHELVGDFGGDVEPCSAPDSGCAPRGDHRFAGVPPKELGGIRTRQD